MIAALPTLLLLLVPLLGAWLVLSRAIGDWRLGLPLAALAWSAWAVGASELLSLGAPHVVGDDPARLTRWWLVAAWALPAAWGATVLGRGRKHAARSIAAARATVASWPRLDRAGAWVLGGCLALTLLVALVAAPDNWDSMTYHLARVETWSRLGGVAHYATNVEPQLYQPPGAELLIAQGYVISGGDHLAALVQWGAYAGCIALAASVVAALGGSGRAQLAGAVLAATVPTAILEATSTQNDLVLAFWLLLAATLAAHVWAGAGRSARWCTWAVLAASGALGMAVLTKGTGLMYGLPVGVLLAAACLRRLGVRRTGVLAAAGVALLALPNVGQWQRNHETFGSVVATGTGENAYRVQDPGPRTLLANVVRNATNHLDLPVPGWNRTVDRGVRRALAAVDIDADDPRTTFMGKPFRVGPFGPHEDHAGSVLLLVLGAWAAGSVLRARRRREVGSGVQLAWLAVVLAQALLFCTLVTWQNWHVRLHLPLTIAIAPLVAVRLAALDRRRWLVGACVVGAAMAPLFLLFNVTRPVIGADSILVHTRTHEYFVPRPQLEAPYHEVVDRIGDAGITEAGLITGVDDWQYPLSVLGAQRSPDVRFREVLGSGPSLRYADPGEIPDAVVCVSCVDPQVHALAEAGLAAVPLDNGGPRQGKGGDVVVTQLWMRPRP